MRLADLENELGSFDLIVNTAPAPVLGKSQLRRVRKDALIIDLASRPGGVDFDYARELGAARQLGAVAARKGPRR